MLEEVRENEDFKQELTEENKSLSCELDFLREKISENQNIKEDIVTKIEENS